MAVLWGETLTREQLDLFYYINNLFKIDGTRSPLEEEVCGILTKAEKKGKIPHPRDAEFTFTNFANPEHPQTRYHHGRVQHILNELDKTANDAYGQLIREDEEAKERSTVFKGVSGRVILPRASLGHRKWSNKHVKPYLYIPLYIIATMCEYEDGASLTRKERYKVVRICLFGNRGGSVNFVTGIATSDDKLGQHMETWMAEQHRYENQFLENTQVFLDVHKQELETAGLEVRIRGVPQRHPVPTVATATTAIEALTLGAAANPSPYQAVGQDSDAYNRAYAQQADEIREAGGRPPPPQPRPNLVNPFSSRPPPSVSDNQPSGSRPEPRAARQQNDKPKGGQETGKRKERSESSYNTEPSKRHETGRTLVSTPHGTSQPQLERGPEGRFVIDSTTTPPLAPIVHGPGHISYPAHRPEEPRPRQHRSPGPAPGPPRSRQLQSPGPPPGPPRSAGSSDHHSRSDRHSHSDRAHRDSRRGQR